MKILRLRNIFALLLLLIIVPSGLNYSGFCMSERRWLSDEEMIRSHLKTFDSIGSLETVDEFLERNPECCRFSGALGQNWPFFLDRIGGYFGGYILITNSTFLYIDDDEIKERYLYSNDGEPITNCGKNYY